MANTFHTKPKRKRRMMRALISSHSDGTWFSVTYWGSTVWLTFCDTKGTRSRGTVYNWILIHAREVASKFRSWSFKWTPSHVTFGQKLEDTRKPYLQIVQKDNYIYVPILPDFVARSQPLLWLVLLSPSHAHQPESRNFPIFSKPIHRRGCSCETCTLITLTRATGNASITCWSIKTNFYSPRRIHPIHNHRWLHCRRSDWRSDRRLGSDWRGQQRAGIQTHCLRRFEGSWQLSVLGGVLAAWIRIGSPLHHLRARGIGIPFPESWSTGDIRWYLDLHCKNHSCFLLPLRFSQGYPPTFPCPPSPTVTRCLHWMRLPLSTFLKLSFLCNHVIFSS